MPNNKILKITSMEDKVAILTNFIPPYRLSLYSEISQRLSNVLFILTSRMEFNRDWAVDWGNLQVALSKSLRIKNKWTYANGYIEKTEVHIPLDILYILLQYRPDILISAEFGIRSFHALMYKLFFPRTTWIIWATLSERSELNRGKIRTVLRRIMIRMVDGIFVNGKSGKRYIEKLCTSKKRIAISPYTIDNHLFSSHFTPKVNIKPTKLLYTGQLIERKGIHIFLPILREWCIRNQRSLELNIVGEGTLKNWLNTFDGFGWLKISLYGSVEYQKLPEIYANNHIFIFPTLVDEWGVVVNEALASGIPVIGSQYSQAVEELIIEGKNGWIFRPDDRESALQVLDRALNINEADYLEMQYKALNSISHITPAIIASKMVNFIRENFQPTQSHS